MTKPTIEDTELDAILFEIADDIGTSGAEEWVYGELKNKFLAREQTLILQARKNELEWAAAYAESDLGGDLVEKANKRIASLEAQLKQGESK